MTSRRGQRRPPVSHEDLVSIAKQTLAKRKAQRQEMPHLRRAKDLSPTLTRQALAEIQSDLKVGKANPRNRMVLLGILNRVLAVDMAKPANRKGDLPKALGLVADYTPLPLHGAIFDTIMELERAHFRAMPKTTFVPPYRDVARAFAAAGWPVDETLVKKVFLRWKPDGPNASRPVPRKKA